MTQHVRKAYRKHRKGTWAAVLAVALVGALAVTLPALADNGGETCTPTSFEPNCIPPASTAKNVYPSQANVGGSNFACTGRDASGTQYVRFQISKPDPAGSVPAGAPAGTYTDQTTGITFKITAPSNTRNAGKYFSWSASGAQVSHVGVNGGNNTAWYDYVANTTQGSVTRDTDLHATRQSSTKYYTASITTFCYVPGNITAKCDAELQSGDETATGIDAIARIAGDTGTCAAKVDDKRFTFTSYVENGSRVVELAPAVQTTCTPTSDPPKSCKVGVAQKIWWPITGTAPDQTVLKYDDPPYDATGDPRTMQWCQKDPFNRGAGEVTLYTGLGYAPGDILPSTDETTCLVRSTEGYDVDAQHPGRWRVDETYSAVDGRIYG